MDADTRDSPIRDLPVRPITREALAPFGDLIAPSDDGAPFGPQDASLDLTRGTPRLYIMRLPRRGLVFRQITRHSNVTQCLAALGGKSWAGTVKFATLAKNSQVPHTFRISSPVLATMMGMVRISRIRPRARSWVWS